jgi:hypothetical protein
MCFAYQQVINEAAIDNIYMTEWSAWGDDKLPNIA